MSLLLCTARRSANRQSTQLAVIALFAAALTPHGARAADPQGQATTTSSSAPTAEAPTTSENQGLEQVVVTATAVSVKKLDASYSITTVDADQIRAANPKSAADLLKVSPGIWPESTGGQTGANIEIAGFPGGGDAPYFTNQIMGSPLYGAPTLSFFEQSSMMRLDDTVERVEIVQGGPAVVFADGQPGATANYILKRGTDKPTGSLGFTYGSENLERLDAFYAGKISDGWYGSAGGFYRYSKGVRDPQYPADNGGQFTATISHDVDMGTFTVWARVLRDKNQFITPIPLIQQGADHFSAYPGFDPLTSTYNSEALRHVFLPTYPGGQGGNADLANGRGADVHFLGANADLQFDGGWSVSDRFLFDGGNMDTNALFSGSNPATLTDELYNLTTGLGGYQLPAGSATATYAHGGGPVDPNQSVIHQGWWFIHKHLFSINNDLRVNKLLFEGNTATLGLYVAHYTDHDKWSLGNQMLMTNTPNARPIVVSYVQNGQTFQRTDSQGFIDFNGNFDITEDGNATNTALYLSDSWRIGPWLFDASARVEHVKASNRVCNLSNVNLDGNPLTVYDNSTPVCNGTFTTTDYNPTRVPWTVGANYELSRNMSVYARVNTGYHYLDFDNGIRGNTTGHTPPEQSIQNQEIGFKYQASWIFADITAYHKKFAGLQYQPTNGAGTPIGSQLVYGSDSKGINFNIVVSPIERLKVAFVGAYLNGHYTHYNACIPYVNTVTGNGCAVIEGKQLQRQPKFRIAVQPSYSVPVPWGDLSAFLTYSHVGPHTQDQSGLQQLGTYDTLDFGAVTNYGENWELRVQGTNVTNTLGLTESNSRIFGAAAGSGGVILARPLEGREVNVEVKYKF
ncbi:MAG: TonB-dependent receptor [Gammaproteobacteria bacterium]|nr:TonB-dependent receptor [Gammaproteobacteria bacterium]